jgi:hypothetical protein
MLALLLPAAALNPIVGKYTTRHGPRWWSAGAFTSCGCLMISFGNLVGGSQEIQVLFVVHACLIGVCFAIAVNAHQIAISVAAQRYEKATIRAREDGQKLGWVLQWLTPDYMLTGLTTSWSAAMLLGPICTNSMDYTQYDGWACLCRGLGGLCLVAGVASCFVWRKW